VQSNTCSEDTDRFRRVKVQPAASRVWAANDTPIRINEEVHLPFYIEDRCIWTTALVSEDIEKNHAWVGLAAGA